LIAPKITSISKNDNTFAVSKSADYSAPLEAVKTPDAWQGYTPPSVPIQN
jgi:hypothetical protein